MWPDYYEVQTSNMTNFFLEFYETEKFEVWSFQIKASVEFGLCLAFSLVKYVIVENFFVVT